jgi:glycosyltransferase involved in cell wall biosynthesis
LAKGLDAHLTVLGCEVPQEVYDQNIQNRITNIAFLNKNEDSGSAVFVSHLKSSHFLLFPTLGECFGIAICEANAYGLPVLAHDTGGISSVITQGKNGFCFPKPQTPEVYADHVIKLLTNESEYNALCLSAYQESIERLNWTTSIKKVRAAIENL